MAGVTAAATPEGLEAGSAVGSAVSSAGLGGGLGERLPGGLGGIDGAIPSIPRRDAEAVALKPGVEGAVLPATVGCADCHSGRAARNWASIVSPDGSEKCCAASPRSAESRRTTSRTSCDRATSSSTTRRTPAGPSAVVFKAFASLGPRHSMG